ncbi:MAG: AI-2E family transporter [Victivallales bacterium]|nr:AI-2E family transporter [Victivallales bacterium]
MKIFDRIKKNSLVGGAINTLSGLIANSRDIDADVRSFSELLGVVIWADGKVDGREIECFRELFAGQVPEKQLDFMVEELKREKVRDIDKGMKWIAALGAERKRDVMDALLKIAFFNGDYTESQNSVLKKIAAGCDVPDDDFALMLKHAREHFERRKRIMRSWTGLIVALVIISIFVLTATFLKSVLFGFILAFIFLPLEKFYERRFASPGILLKIFAAAGAILLPLKNISNRIRRRLKPSSSPDSTEELEQKRIAANVNKAVGASAFTLMFMAIVAVLLVFMFSVKYVAGIGMDIKSWADSHVQAQQNISHASAEDSKDAEIEPEKDVDIKLPPNTANALASREESYIKSLVGSLIIKLEKIRADIEKWPLVQSAIDEASAVLKDQNNQKAFISMIMKRTGGMFSFTAGFFSGFFSLIFDVLMTLFFFMLFLQKMALFNANSRTRLEAGGTSEYIVKSIFESNWMPYTGDETRAQAKQILEDIGLMFKAWLKGYASIIAIEITVYVSVFMLLGVPYAPILGMIAGCTILLPYIGPFASASLTVLVCLAVGGSHVSIVLILAVILAYIIMNGILEQFFLYPGFVGEALGLTNLETIIVVLLGGVFAGLAGMIFAVPTASVMKYLIPRIYHCWQPVRRKHDENIDAEIA